MLVAECWAARAIGFSKRGEYMIEIIAYCGLACHTCPIYLATRQENKAEQTRIRIEISQLLKGQYGMNYEPEDITDCDGCRTDSGRLFSGCRNCLIRKCATERRLENCAYCAEYACERLEAFFNSEPTAKIRLDEVRHSILWLGASLATSST
jgi:Protein of unknown function (DUF3795)